MSASSFVLRICLLAATITIAAAQKKPFTVEALLLISRVSDPQLSPDGKTVAFTVQSIDVAGNTRPRQIWTVPLDGSAPRQITNSGNNERPRWSPDSATLAFISDRSGASQVWIMNADGSSPKQITSLSTEAEGVSFFPDGKNLLFVSAVYPDCPDEACNKSRLDAANASMVKARVYTSLLYRHWNQWQGPRRKHLLTVSVDGGAPKDLTLGDRDVPPFSLGGGDDYAISPDSKEICYAVNPGPSPATTTNTELFVVPAEGGEPRKITVNPGADNTPLYSPDGKYLAWRAQLRGGYESDRWRVVVMDRATARTQILTDGIDRPVGGLTWSTDSQRLFFTIEDRGRQTVQMVPATGGGARAIITGAAVYGDMQFTPDGRTMIYTQQTGSRPVEIYKVSSGGGASFPLTRMNDAILTGHQLTPFEEFWVEGAEKNRVHSFLVKPHGFESDKKYPVLFLIHGGPQGAWQENWTYRWNAQVFAGAGFLVVMPNPRGSTGYGQQFTDEINSDWGGRVYDDLMAVVNYVAQLPEADSDRMAAAGGSYGGYMVNWLLGHSQRFKALVSHAGVYDLRSMAGETEELWFPLWEFRGMPWDNPEVYQRWSPSQYVQEFKTPTLVVHGELDYRVPYGQGLQLFTALQMQKVPSKLLLFPDEGHWIQKPQNSLLWYKTLLDWVTEWTRKPVQTGTP